MRLDRCVLAHGDHDDGRCAWCGETLPWGRRRWCQDSCATAWRDNHVWTFARNAVLARADYECERCGDPGTTSRPLHVHHDPPVRGNRGTGCRHHQNRLKVLCQDCHVLAHREMDARPGAQLALFRAA